MNAIKTFFAAHKTTIMLASAALVIGAKSLSFVAQNQQAPVMEMPTQQQMMQHQMPGQQGGQMEGYNQQMPEGYGQQMPQQGGGFFDGWFGGGDEAEGNGAYTNAANAGQNYGGYYDGGNAGGGYSAGGYTGGYNTSSGAGTTSAYSGGADYTSYQQPNTDGSHERFIDAIREETKYNDADGNSYKLSSGYDYNYVNSTTNEYVQTNDASVTPGAYSSYSAVTPSDYSSSSSSSSSTGE